jgi:hypothetical protein
MLRALLLTAALWLVAPPASAQLGWLFSPRPSYALDGVSRAADAPCDPQRMVRYRSPTLRTSRSVIVDPAFAERLPALERVVREVAIAHYGRAPRRMLTVGGFVCRGIRGRADRISEHALGNALDVSGFEIGPMPRGATPPADMPRALRRAFTVSLAHDWSRDTEIGRYHGRFLRALVARLVEDDVFRVIYGPAHRGHGGHFHFDMSPFRWIDV